ncbi:MAG: methyltransferase domain-containing protein [Smithellaceae bacterium]|nr:methyltransferase domain-containing protein [Smithellaceae bacterium]
MKILNLGCGTKTSNSPEVINIDWSIYLRLRKVNILRPVVPLFIKGERLERFKSLPDNIMVHNLAKGIPFDSDSIDVVYHSHMLEHLDRDVAIKFLMEVKRVLKRGGIHRIVVPDFEKACSAYVAHIESCETDPTEFRKHDSYIAPLLEQSVRKEACGASQQTPLHRFVENLVLGDARRRGETHQWVYDRISLQAALVDTGYEEVYIQRYDTSLIPNWSAYRLDVDTNGYEYKPESLYVEACK